MVKNWSNEYINMETSHNKAPQFTRTAHSQCNPYLSQRYHDYRSPFGSKLSRGVRLRDTIWACPRVGISPLDPNIYIHKFLY